MKYTKEQEKVNFLRLMRADLNTLVSKTNDQELQGQLRALAETVEYSDPMSSDALKDLEMRVMDNLALLREELEENKVEEARLRIKKICSLWIERNEKCAVLKNRK